ncbi:MAG: hypothetical protein ACI4I0_07090 [Acutalibacteraceae bacterium]
MLYVFILPALPEIVNRKTACRKQFTQIFSGVQNLPITAAARRFMSCAPAVRRACGASAAAKEKFFASNGFFSFCLRHIG